MSSIPAASLRSQSRPAPRKQSFDKQVRRYLGTPKGVLLLVFIGLLAVAAPREGLDHALSTIVAAVVPAALLDIAIVRSTKHSWIVPDSALLSGLIVAMVLSTREPWYVPVVAGSVATLSKHLLRDPWNSKRHIFNPAALALLVCLFVFSSGQSWWGALPGLPVPYLLLLIAGGYLVAYRINKLPLFFSFAGCYIYVITLTALLTMGESVRLAELYRVPYLNSMLFCGFFMVTDPPTSVGKTRDQVTLGAVVGFASYCAFLAGQSQTFLLIGLLAGNVWLTWNRRQVAVAPDVVRRQVAPRR